MNASKKYRYEIILESEQYLDVGELESLLHRTLQERTPLHFDVVKICRQNV